MFIVIIIIVSLTNQNLYMYNRIDIFFYKEPLYFKGEFQNSNFDYFKIRKFFRNSKPRKFQERFTQNKSSIFRPWIWIWNDQFTTRYRSIPHQNMDLKFRISFRLAKLIWKTQKPDLSFYSSSPNVQVVHFVCYFWLYVLYTYGWVCYYIFRYRQTNFPFYSRLWLNNFLCGPFFRILIYVVGIYIPIVKNIICTFMWMQSKCGFLFPYRPVFLLCCMCVTCLL